MEKVFIVIKDEVWDGEDWGEVLGAYRKWEDAVARVKIARDHLYEDWKDDIDTDTAQEFCAFREGDYVFFHCLIRIEETELI